VADRVAILHRGKLARIGTIEELTGGGVRFRAPAELDLTDLSASLGVVVSTEGDGRYRIDAEASPQLVADLGTWLAGRGATLGELRSGASLEDAYVEVVGDLAHQISEEAPTSRRRGRRNR